MQQLNVVLADAAPVVLAGFKAIVEKHPYIHVTEEVTSLLLLEDALARSPGCVAIVDWHMTTLDLTGQLAQKTSLILSAMPESAATRHQALRLGVRGFLSTHQSAADIRKAVVTVGGGNIWVGDTTAEVLLSHHLTDQEAAQSGDGVSRLTAREKQVIQMACEGLKSRAIAMGLRISEPTVAHHFTSIYSKLGVEDRVGLVIYAYRHFLNIPKTLALESPVRALLHGTNTPGER